MPMFREKGRMVEAIRCTGNNLDEIVKFASEYASMCSDVLVIGTIEDCLPVEAGDWIVRDADGKCRPWSETDFAAAYEPCPRCGEDASIPST